MAGKSSNARVRRFILRWHRRIGLVSSLLILVLTMTGVLLLRTEQLGLDRTIVGSTGLAGWYGLKPESSPVHFAVGENWVSVIDGHVYLDGDLAGEGAGVIIGAVVYRARILIASRRSLHRLEIDGPILDVAQTPKPPGEITALAASRAGELVIDTSSGRYGLSFDGRDWTPYAGRPAWSRPGTPPSPVVARVNRAHGLSGLPLSRLLLDLHTGRLFGAWGPYLMDAAAIFLILLTASGIYNWWTGGRRR